MPNLGDIKSFKMGNELHICPNCGYELGFHISFLNANAGTNKMPLKSTKEVHRIILICPECGSRYDVGWKPSFNE
ncbi:MAG: hypothetical protein ABR887_03850 [Methanoregulaceae archaeon]|jgi:predicted RNA-binding Zn-ribbon protein involved in translation (DUF1610 family)